VNRFVDHLQVVNANNYNTIVDVRTTNHSTLRLLSLLSLIFTCNRSPQWLVLTYILYSKPILSSNRAGKEKMNLYIYIYDVIRL
jgi:hypothetical protein